MSKFFIYPYNGHIAQKFIVNWDIDPMIIGQHRIQNNIPFFLIDTNIDFFPEDLTFFESWTIDFSDPDGYGSSKTLDELIYDKHHNTNDYQKALLQFNKIKQKNVTADMSKACLIWKDKLRSDRKPLLEKLDVQYMRALEAGNTEAISTIVNKKQFLRDITNDPRLENANNTDDLKQIIIPPNFIEE